MKRILLFGGTAFAVAFVLAILMSLLPFPSESRLILPVVIGVLVGFMAVSLSGNKKVVKVDAGARAQALSALPPDGQAAVWVYREGFIGKAVGLNVSVDGQDVAQLKSPTCTRILIPAGPHTFAAAMGVGGAFSPNAASVSIDAKAGETRVFKLSMKMGAVKNTLMLDAQSDVAGALQRLASTPMVATTA